MGAHSELSDAELVARAGLGGGEAYGELVSRYARAAYGLALSVTRRHEDAEDAAQEAFVVALERIDECRNPEKFAGWFLAIVRNRARNLVRREALRQGEALPFDLKSPAPGPDRVTERRELEAELIRALAELTDAQRAVVILHDLEGWKHREIARKLDMPAGTVRSHLHFARQRLRECLSGLRDPEAEERQG